METLVFSLQVLNYMESNKHFIQFLDVHNLQTIESHSPEVSIN